MQLNIFLAYVIPSSREQDRQSPLDDYTKYRKRQTTIELLETVVYEADMLIVAGGMSSMLAHPHN